MLFQVFSEKSFADRLLTIIGLDKSFCDVRRCFFASIYQLFLDLSFELCGWDVCILFIWFCWRLRWLFRCNSFFWSGLLLNSLFNFFKLFLCYCFIYFLSNFLSFFSLFSFFCLFLFEFFVFDSLLCFCRFLLYSLFLFRGLRFSKFFSEFLLSFNLSSFVCLFFKHTKIIFIKLIKIKLTKLI